MVRFAKAEEGLVGYWSFDEGQGNVANDSSGNGNNETIYGATWVDGISGKALSFNEVDDYIESQRKASELGLTGDLSFSVSAWVYIRSFSPGG